MPLILYYHPLASFCWKVLIALYENETPFEPRLVNLADPADRAAFQKVWPIAKFPVLRDDSKNQTVPESSIIVEYLGRHYPGRTALIPADPDRARDVRLRDRFIDLYVHEPMQKIVTDKLRPLGKNDPHGVELARAQLAVSYATLEAELAGKEWSMGAEFTLADCAAAPALYYANLVMPFGEAHGTIAAYLERLQRRPSFARVRAEAEPFFAMFPG